MLLATVVETPVHGRIVELYAGTLQPAPQAHHTLVLRCIGWCIRDSTDHVLSFRDALACTEGEHGEETED